MINKFRLDKNSQPEKYEIFIEPDLDNEKFTGNESIKLSIRISSSPGCVLPQTNRYFSL